MADANTQTSPEIRLQAINNAVANASKRAGRASGDTKLIAVSKTRSAEDIRPVLAAGHRHFGENRVQEAMEKWPELRAAFPDVTLHLIGQLQSNKAKDAVAGFDCIHAVDRPSLINALGQAMREATRQVPCFLQVNIGAEPQKGGCIIAELPQLLELAEQQGVPVIGLMCLPPAGIEPAPFFALLAELAQRHGLDELSMGMSDDFETAIMLGATYIRVGTALFGERAGRLL